MTHKTETTRIRIDLPQRRGDRIHWEGELAWPSGATHRIFFEFSIPDDRAYPPRARPFLLAFLLPAMHAGAPLELELPVDEVTRNNLMEWQEALASWNPQTLKVVPIVAPAGAEPERRSLGALTAFSGGVDSNFTVWRHTRPEPAPLYSFAPLRAGLMIHGFDIPLEQEKTFESAWSHSRATLGSYGLRAFRLATNVRTLDRIPGCMWGENAHGIWLAAALSCFEPWFDRMLIPSTFPYQVLLFPWGSNPVTDPLFSSAATGYWHDGAAHSKLAKVHAIAREPVVQQNLRVCWEGEQLDRNCGKCFKCLATQICFQLSGVDRPEALSKPCTLDEVSHLPVTNSANAWLVRSMAEEARQQGQEGLASALERALARAAAQNRKRKKGWFKRLWARKKTS